MLFALEAKIGLSPLARGTPIPNSWTVDRARFIPAGAGNTHMFSPLPPYNAVYPRWRGEHGWRANNFIDDFGLSPLARGTHLNAHQHA
ncbi:hypothetical protein SEEN202_17621 [Salmonella enterica subsp. enterica serovar Newport str. CVM 35202]|nr:hypothetical protein SEEN202_17621 [Salmonella enterica subsp. enterica serovar Newport str. CVM 35202]